MMSSMMMNCLLFAVDLLMKIKVADESDEGEELM